MEQFGDRYVTVFNSNGKAVRARLSARGGARAAELVDGGAVVFGADGSAEVELAPDAVRVLDFGEAR